MLSPHWLRGLLPLVLLCGWLSTATAQKTPRPFPVSPTYSYPETRSEGQRIADSLLAPLDKSRITTGILYDRVPTIARLDVFEPADTSDYTHFRQALYELHAASYNTQILPSRRQLSHYAERHAERDTVVLGLLHQRFNYI